MRAWTLQRTNIYLLFEDLKLVMIFGRLIFALFKD